MLLRNGNILEQQRDAPLQEQGEITLTRAPHAPLRVLLIVESAAGGTGRHVLDLAEGLIARGVEVHLIHSTRRIDDIFRQRIAKISGLAHISLALRTSVHPADLAAVLKIRRYIRRNGPFDIIHGHSSKGGALARLAGLGFGASVIYTLHGLIMMDPGLARWKWLFYLSIELGLGLWTQRIIAVSPEEARAAKKLGLGKLRVVTIPNGVGPANNTRSSARHLMNAAPADLVVGFIGRLVDQKAPDVLIRGFAEMAHASTAARLAIIGAGPLEDSCRQLAGELGIADRIFWLGERDARPLLSGFDLFAISSRKEGLPYVVLEAMAAGLPVVATASAGVESLIESGVNGEIVPTGDGKAFGRALIHLASDADRLAESGRGSLRRASLFTIDSMVERTLDLYRELQGEARRS